MNNFEKICFIGLGGAGQRHARIFRKILPDSRFFTTQPRKNVPLLKPDFEVDLSTTVTDFYDIETLNDTDDVERIAPDLIVISTPTAFHDSQINFYLDLGCDVFCEKPAFNNVQQAIVAKDKIETYGSLFFVSFQRLFHPAVKKVKHIWDGNKLGKLLDVDCRVSSFLPAWHPYEDYRDLYAANRKLGGGVTRTECHELYFLLHLFGKPKQVSKFVRKGRFLDIDVEDYSAVTIQFQDCIARLSLNFCSEFAERVITFSGTHGQLRVDFNNSILTLVSHEETSEVRLDTVSLDEQFELQAQYLINNFERGDISYIENSIYLAEIFEVQE